MSTASAPLPAINPDAMMAFAHRVVGDLAAAMAGPLLYIGDRDGLFAALAPGEAMSMAELARRTGLNERYVREWASAMVASEYLDYDAAAGTVRLPPEKAMVLAHGDSPVFCGGIAQMIPDHYRLLPQLRKAFRDGGGVPYSAYGPDTFEGTERLFRTGYLNFLAQQWIPAMPEVHAKLQAGAKVGDVGCGRGQALLTLARAYPASQFWGFDNELSVVAHARAAAAQAGVGERVLFEVRASDDLPQTHDFDLVMNCDSLHDMKSPEACARSIAGALKPDGTWFVIEPNMQDALEANISPIGKLFYSVSTLQCMTCSLASGGAGYGTGMGPANVRRVATEAGLTQFRKLAIDNPFNQFFAIGR